MSRQRRPQMLAALAALWCVARLAFAALSPDAFTQEFVSTLRAALPELKVEIVGPLQLSVVGASGEPQTAYLDNTYKLYQSDPDSRDALIARQIASIKETTGVEAAFDAANVVPIIKHRDWVRVAMGPQVRGGEPVPRVDEGYNEKLVILYAEDTPANIKYLTPSVLEKSGLDRAALRDLAVKNLRAKLPGIKVERGDLFSMVIADGNYEASLLLFPELWTPDAAKVDGDIVVAVPSRDVVVFTGSRNKAGVAKMREIAKQIVAESAYTLSSDLYIYRKGKFELYSPPADIHR